MNFKQIIQEVSGDVFHPVYVLAGEEAFFIDKIAEAIERKALSESEKAFNQTILYGKEIDFKTIVDNARQFPMMAARRLVLVKEAQQLKNSDLDKLVPYLENPSPQTILVLCHKHKKLDKRTKYGKAAGKNAILFESKKLYDNQIAGWILDYVKTQNATISPNAAALMAEYLGSDLSKISNEIEKLLINTKDKQIQIDHIHEQIGISKEYNVFEFQKALGQKNVVKSYRIINHMSENAKSNPIPMMVSSLYQYFTKIMIISGMKNASESVLLGALKLGSPYFLREYKAAAANFTVTEIQNILLALSKADQRSKGIGARTNDYKAILQDFVNSIFLKSN